MFRVSVLSMSQMLVLVGCVSFIFLLSVYGDLAGSLVKRSLAIKDSGSLLPGIGGIFDLIDSPSFTVPFFWFLLALHRLNGPGMNGFPCNPVWIPPPFPLRKSAENCWTRCKPPLRASC